MTVLLFLAFSILRFLAQNTLLSLSDAPNTVKREPKTQEAQSWRATLFSRARESDYQDQSCETILAHVQRDPDDLQRVQVEIVPNCFLLHRYSSLMELFSHQEDSQPAEQYLFPNLPLSTRAGLYNLPTR